MLSRFPLVNIPTNSLLHQLWSLPSGLVDILIAIAMTVLVRDALFFDTLTCHWCLKAKTSDDC